MFGYPWKKTVKFSKVPQTEDYEALIADSDGVKISNSLWKIGLTRSCGILVLIISLPAAVLLGVWLERHWFSDPVSRYVEHVSRYSPLIKDVGLNYETVVFNGSLLKENVFRQDAGTEVDAAWASLGVDYRSAIVPSDQAEKSGLSLDQVRLNEKYGGGFPANVEGLHHLHCLNLLRQSLYYNFDYYHKRGEGAFKNSDDILRFHVSHCLDILRQQIMCTVDIGVLGQVWWDKEQPKAYPDFNTKHKCRDFEAVRHWAEEHQAPKDVPLDYLRAPLSREVVYASIP